MEFIHKVAIGWAVLGISGIVLFMYSEHLNGEDLTLHDIVFLPIVGCLFGGITFLIGFASFFCIGVEKLEHIHIFSINKKSKKSND